MVKASLTGSRIRERRQALQIKQADLAKSAQISPSYLNLIEHNRRRVAGKVLVDISRALDIDVTSLTEGAEEALLEALREAATMPKRGSAEIDRLEEFVSRFPGWANLVAAQRARMITQDRTIEALNNRLTHDPFLAEALHDLVSNVTAIRSSTAILSDTPDLEVAWRDRFLRNITEETKRLIAGSQSLVSYFDGQVQNEHPLTTPQEMLDAVLAQRGFFLAELEEVNKKTQETQIAQLVDANDILATPQARALAKSYFRVYAQLARDLPGHKVAKAFQSNPDPAALAERFDVALDHVMHRLAVLPAETLGAEFGLIVADPAGALVFRKTLVGFPVPKFGAVCAVWPLFDALVRPMSPQHHWIQTPPGRRFESWSVATPIGQPGFDAPTIFRAWMLIRADERDTVQTACREVGTTCRLCPRARCAARREPSILTDWGQVPTP